MTWQGNVLKRIVVAATLVVAALAFQNCAQSFTTASELDLQKESEGPSGKALGVYDLASVASVEYGVVGGYVPAGYQYPRLVFSLDHGGRALSATFSKVDQESNSVVCSSPLPSPPSYRAVADGLKAASLVRVDQDTTVADVSTAYIRLKFKDETEQVYAVEGLGNSLNSTVIREGTEPLQTLMTYALQRATCP